MKAKKKISPSTSSQSQTVPARRATVQEVYVQAERFMEAALLMRTVADEGIRRFHPEPHMTQPELLLRRPGAGPRPAQVDAIVAAHCALLDAASEMEAQGRALLDVVIELAGAAMPEVVQDLPRDEVVRLKDVQDEYAHAGGASGK